VPIVTDAYATPITVSAEALPLWNDAVLADAGRADDALVYAAARDAERPWQCDGRLLTPRLAGP
jgi:hypothetical protein